VTTPPLKIGLVGCGHIGRAVHLETLRRLPDVQVTSLADVDRNCLDAAHARCPDARVFNDFRDLIEQADVDAVVICLPNAFHAEAAIAALESGKHVYLEKPLAIELEEGERVRKVWKTSGCIGMIGFNYRCNPLHLDLRQKLLAGKIGDLLGARTAWTAMPYHAPEWKALRQTGGGVLLDLGSHHFDLIQFWFDQPIVEVFAAVRSHRRDDDTASVQARLATGMIVQSFFSIGSVDDERFEVAGSNGRLWFDRFNSWSVELSDLRKQSIPERYLRRAVSSLPRTRFAINKLRSPWLEPSFATALARFVRAARTREQVRPDFDDGFNSLAVVLAAEESARLGSPVPVSPAATAR